MNAPAEPNKKRPLNPPEGVRVTQFGAYELQIEGRRGSILVDPKHPLAIGVLGFEIDGEPLETIVAKRALGKDAGAEIKLSFDISPGNRILAYTIPLGNEGEATLIDGAKKLDQVSTALDREIEKTLGIMLAEAKREQLGQV